MHTLEYRKVIKIEGELAEIKNYLQGIITANINSLSPLSPFYAIFLSPKGKIISDVFIHIVGGVVFLDIEVKATPRLFSMLNMYKIGRNITIEEVDEMYVNLDNATASTLEPRIVGFNRLISQDKKENILQYKAYREQLLQELIPEFDGNIEIDKFLPIDFNMERIANCISYTKGCYVGQEVTARTKHSGIIRKALVMMMRNEFEKTADMVECTLINSYEDKALVLSPVH